VFSYRSTAGTVQYLAYHPYTQPHNLLTTSKLNLDGSNQETLYEKSNDVATTLHGAENIEEIITL
jgi:hypothetical protein